MHEFALVDLAGLALISWVLVRLLGPFASALARRVGGRASAATADPAVASLREEVEQLQERIDFLERALASRGAPAQLPPTRTPV